MKKIPLKKLSFSLIWLVVLCMLIPLDLVARRRQQHLDSDETQVAISQQYDDVSDVAAQEDVGMLQQQLDWFKEAVERFRSCLVEGNCSDEERRVVVDMANKMLKLSLLGVGIGFVETGEFVAERIQNLKGARKGKKY